MVALNPRKYGEGPFKVAVLHGGPGAPGSAAPIAQGILCNGSVLEPFQTADSVDGQGGELRGILESCTSLPVVLVGHSWGAWLGYIYAARYPAHVAKLVLVASGPFLPEYAERIMETRMSRLTDDDRGTVQGIMERLGGGVPKSKDLALLGKILGRADAYHPIDAVPDAVECQAGLHIKVWGEAEELRRSGRLLDMGRNITCPVVAVHGDFDPHPAEGVRGPLSGILANFRFILLEKCGHEPWAERLARGPFFKILNEELEAVCG